MPGVVAVQLQWKYEPANYLEEPIVRNFPGGTLRIEGGLALATLDLDSYEAEPELCEKLAEVVESQLRAAQIFSHMRYDLGKPSRTDLREDGTKHYYLEVEPMVMTMSVGAADLVVKDKDGNIVSCTKTERLDKQNRYASLIERFRRSDQTLDRMLLSYAESVRDPDNELIHLYEVRDALAANFGSKNKAVSQLGINHRTWDAIGELANHRPLRQGRHRGKAAGSLRDADASELESARKMVAQLIERYLDYLERNEIE